MKLTNRSLSLNRAELSTKRNEFLTPETQKLLRKDLMFIHRFHFRSEFPPTRWESTDVELKNGISNFIKIVLIKSKSIFLTKLDAEGKTFKFLVSLLFIALNLFLSTSSFSQITQVGTTQTAANSGTTITIATPGGIQVGDVMFVNVVQDDNQAGTNLGTDASSSGWTLIDGRSIGISGNNEWWGTILYKVAVLADVTATTFVFSLDSDADGGIGGIIAFRGVNVTGGVTETGAAGGPFDVDPGIINGIATDATLTAAAISTVSANAAVIMFGLTADNNTLSTWACATSPTTLVEIMDANNSNGADQTIGAAWAIKPATGTTGAGSATISASDPNGALLVALKACVAAPINPIAGGSPTVCTGGVTPAFTDATAGGVWSIINGTGTATIAQTGIATGVTVGNVTVVYTAADANGCPSSASTALSVITVPAQPSTITGSTLLCPSISGNIYSVTNVAGVTYTWAVLGTGWSVDSGNGSNSITLTTGTAGPQTLTVTPSNSCGNGTARTLAINLVAPGVVAKGTNPGPACGTLDPGTTVNTDGGNGTAYRWEQSTNGVTWVNATGTITGNTYNPPAISTTTYYRRVRTNGGSCELASNVLQYVINPPPTVPAITGGSPNVCVGSNTPAFTDATPGGTWSSSNTGIATINSGTGVAHGVAVGSTNIIYTVTDVNGCTGSTSVALSVITAPAQPSTITGGSGLCANAMGISYSVTNVAGVTYTWAITGSGWSIASGQGTNSITINAGSTFPQTLTVTPSNSCGNGTPRTLTIDGVPIFCTSCNTCTVTASANPNLTGSCEQLKIALVIDESGSIAGSEAQVEAGVMAFVNSLSCTGVQLAVIEFNSGARYVLNDFQVVNGDIVTAMQDYFDNVNNPLLVANADYSPANYTNYHAALLAVDALSGPANLVLFFTDGVPTEVYLTNPPPAFGTTGTQCGGTGAPEAAEIGNPALVANKLKCEGTHMFVLGVGDIGPAQVPTIAMISGSVAHSMANTIATSDYALENFDALAMCLSMFVSELCPFEASASSQDVCPNGSNGSITITVPNQFLPYDYAYFTQAGVVPLGSATNVNTSPLVISGLSPGTYRVEIYIDLPGNCTRTETFFVTIVAGAVNVVASVTGTTDPSCADPDAGSATLTITAGEAPFMITLKKGGVTEPGYPVMGYFPTVYTATGLDAGSYSFELKDANLCNTDIDMFTINAAQNCCNAICPSNIQVPCGSSTDPAQTGSPTNTTGCGTISHSDMITAGVCPTVQVINRTWTSSISGQICIQTITVVDNTAPVIIACAVTRTIEGCNTDAITSPVFSAITASSSETVFESAPNNGNTTDACGVATVKYIDVASGTCPIVVTRKWTVSDACGNSSTCIQTINVNDTTAPTIVACAVPRAVQGCGSGQVVDPPYSPIMASSSEAVFEDSDNQGNASDACGITSVKYKDMLTGTCPTVVTRTWTISDACGNSATCNQIYLVTNSFPPVITASAVPRSFFGCDTLGVADPPFSSILAFSTESVFEDPANQGADSDACGIATVTYIDVVIGTFPLLITRTWTLINACGLATVSTQALNVDDTIPPVISPCAITRTIEGCNVGAITDPPFSPTIALTTETVFEDATNQGNVTDNCNVFGLVAYIDVATGTCPIVVARKWIVSDGSGHSASCTQTINVNDTTAPAITACAATRTIEGCNTGAITNPPFSTTLAASTEAVFESAPNNGNTSDACGIVAVTYIDVAAGTCPTVVTRKWTVSDACGHSSTCNQTINVNDTTAPTITACAATRTIEGCNPTAITSPPFSATVAASTETEFESAPNNGNTSDACGITSVTYIDVAAGTCPTVVTRKWTVSDACGHSSTCNQTINVNDTTAPTITACAVTRTIEGCNPTAITSPPFSTTLAASTEVVFESAPNNGNTSDACGITSVTYIDVATGTCPTVVTRKWTVSDACGHSSTCNQTINVNDTTAPTITTCAVTRTIQGCNTGAITDPVLSATVAVSSEAVFEDATNQGNTSDACGITTVTYIDVAAGTCPTVVTRKWTISDACGNSSTCNQTINVNDTTKPTITACAVTRTIEGCNTGAITDPPFSATSAASSEVVFEDATNQGNTSDACGITTVTYIDVAAGTCPTVVTRKWTISDACGNSSTCNQTINVNDTTAPTITACAVTRTIQGCNTGAITDPVFSTTSAASNEAVFEDATNQGNSSDACGITSVTYIDVAAGTCPTVVTRKWTISDACGNSSTCNQTINVNDTTAPTITACAVTRTIQGCNTGAITDPVFSTTSAASSEAVFEDATNQGNTSDACGITTVTYIDVSAGTCPTVVTRKWTISDACGNSSTCNQTINVNDTTSPVISACAVPRTIQGCNTGAITDPPFSPTGDVSSEAVFEDATNLGNTSDACGITSVTYIDLAFGTCPIQVTRKWTVSDACGHSSTCNQSINIFDTTAPSVVACAVTRTIEGCNTGVITDPPFATTSTASSEAVFEDGTNQGNISDACGITTVTYIDVATGTCPTVVTRKWTISDACGNSSTCNQTINVNDTTAPTITACAVTRTLEGCGLGSITDPPYSATSAASSEGVFEDATNQGNASDACGITAVTYIDVSSGTCPMVVTRKWTVSDACGHSSTCNQTINVDDNTNPAFTLCPANLVLGCVAGTDNVALINAWIATATATDACDASVAITTNYDGTSVPSFSCEGGMNITFTATDDCGNSASCISTVTKPCFSVETYVYIEGAAVNPNGSNSYTLPMRTTLNNLRVLPGQTLFDPFLGNKYTPPGQPYSGAPWNYPGTEGNAYDSGGDPNMGTAGYPATVVDWILVSLRLDSAGTGGPVCQAAALLHSDGHIEFVQPLACCGVNENTPYYITIEHRNHLIVMSNAKVPWLSHKLSYDFRFQQSWEDPLFPTGTFARQKELIPGFPGKFGMYAGNGNQTISANSDTDINFDDRSFWETQNGQVGEYRMGDYNLNGDTNFNDRVVWERNNGKFTSVPRN